MRTAPSLMLIFSFLLCVISLSVLANDQAFKEQETHLFLKYGVSNNKHEVSRADLVSKTIAQNATLLNYDNNTQGYELGVDALLPNNIILGLGYRNFGELNNTWQIETTRPALSVEQLHAIMPVIGNGPYISAGYRYHFNDTVFAQASIELQSWQQKYYTNGTNLNGPSASRSGSSTSINLGVGYAINDQINVILNANKHKFENQSAISISIGLQWRFDSYVRRLLSAPNNVQASKESAVVANPSTAEQQTHQPIEPAKDADKLKVGAVNHDLIAQQKAQRKVLTEAVEYAKQDHQLAHKSILKNIIYYRVGSSFLNKKDNKIIDQVAETFQSSQTILITGFADMDNYSSEQERKQTLSTNTKLAHKRANAIKQALIQRGVNRNLIKTSASVSPLPDKLARKSSIEIIEQTLEPLSSAINTVNNKSTGTNIDNSALSIKRLDIIYFGVNSISLNSKDRRVIDEFVTASKQGRTIELIGSADGAINEPNKQIVIYNQKLALQRANAIKQALLQRGVAGEQIKTDVKVVTQHDKFARNVTMVLR
ncbi:MAG: OmpA family protein [Glaciecola sp.]